MNSLNCLRRLKDTRGATIIFVAVAMVVLLGMAAMAVDVGYFYVIRNEMQNAADSGALAGAQVLYNSAGTSVNAGANTMATTFVNQHYSENAAVQVASVKRGHWSFATRTFTENETDMSAVPLWDSTTAELDANTHFINAVQVITTRRVDATTGKPEPPFFARVLGVEGPVIQAVGVAYIGFAGTLEPQAVDQPVAICSQAILAGTSCSTYPRGEDCEYTCGVGRMINSASGAGSETGGWTNFTQPCETASSSSVRPLVCTTGNADALTFGTGMGTTNGQIQNAFTAIDACWRGMSSLDTDGNGIPDMPWTLTLPVVDCPGNAVSNCSRLTGAVTVKIVWITETDKTNFAEVPRKMGDWTCSTMATGRTAGQQCWNEFVAYFHLKDILAGTDATYEDKTMYFLPDCAPHEPHGTTGGENYGILAKIPVLVK